MFRWFPWRYVVRRVARARGLIDPVSVLARLHGFAEPAEVAAPWELLRAGVVFHARGLMNTAAIQHNLDWVWPHWAERQFDPLDDAFIPRAFSITHVNLTHRNWTAIGIPGCERLPIVDPRGLLTPFWDGWSLDGWIVADGIDPLVPSRGGRVQQRLDWSHGDLAVVTHASQGGLSLETRARVVLRDDSPTCVWQLAAWSDEPAWMVVSLRPSNPEGVSFINEVEVLDGGRQWRIDRQRTVEMPIAGERTLLSTYRKGDVFACLPQGEELQQARCHVGMCTSAALYRLPAGQTREVIVNVPLADDAATAQREARSGHFSGWEAALQGACELRVANPLVQSLFESALRTLILHSPGEVYPGPYTYKRFWFRDAAFILHALLCAGFAPRVRAALERFPARQTRAGYFLSQEGEWDSNGEALWILDRYCQLTGQPPDPAWEKPIRRGAQWIQRKLIADGSDKPHAGLFPAGFSAEHLGPNDYYYWDDFWGAAGLQSAARLLSQFGDRVASAELQQRAKALLAAIDRSLERTAAVRNRPGVPASPYRRLDAGAIGSLAAGYPLALWQPHDVRLLDTIEFLLEHNFVHGGFFQDMIHSGINAYLTLHVAQVLLRAGDPRFQPPMEAVADLASPTGQWPEAIHPRTLGGCMGDGQHVWAAAEWVMMVRNCFVREEPEVGTLVLASGIPSAWWNGTAATFGPAPTPWGSMTVEVRPSLHGAEVHWQANWTHQAPRLEIRLPEFDRVMPAADCSGTVVMRAMSTV